MSKQAPARTDTKAAAQQALETPCKQLCKDVVCALCVFTGSCSEVMRPASCRCSSCWQLQVCAVDDCSNWLQVDQHSILDAERRALSAGIACGFWLYRCLRVCAGACLQCCTDGCTCRVNWKGLHQAVLLGLCGSNFQQLQALQQLLRVVGWGQYVL